jgi:hypothetical protein
MQRQEIPNNTDEQVRDYLHVALALVAELDPPQDLRPAVFEAAFAAVSGKQIVMSQPQPVDLRGLRLPGAPH